MSDPNLFTAARAKKSLGQHFLRDEGVLRRIAALVGAEPGDRLMEIGPGPGALTALLREMPWERLILLEKDDHYAAEHAARPLPGLEVIPGDALAYPWEALEGPWKIIGNLPYNVASPLMWDIVLRVPSLARGVFMIQKEVADRILASPGTKDYGALTVWIRSFASPRRGFVVGPGAFSPPPKVDSAVVVFDPIDRAARPERPDLLARLVKLCFSQRRKQLQGILRHAGIPG
ncbi:MAG: 16S rRNA (adenine(1518)-N(6)/adenine(1519)-N(6))-dimethyltransferase RsmA, partial [Mailhella sp.]|nr:16S rRNA (adenine(1518)-N(6)/adenine(1519)-N(6))-dimethyltransferase RsmA [Mailhella sp.]